MEFLFRDEGKCTFMNPATYEQVEILGEVLGPAERSLQSGMEKACGLTCAAVSM